ncbi:AAA family ATPase [Paenibacillus thermotolerans]|uniref:AAA family ATPase n=1 Tax=Paenibacillus thermotolerans TaxID=3027807 RepID=UPI002368E1F5|nr:MULTISPECIES: AAA family ATPase [unclassified Paenibacillus]
MSQLEQLRRTNPYINHTVLTAAYACSFGLSVAGVILNGYREGQADAMEETAMMIERFGGVPVIGKLPWIPDEPAAPEEWTAWRGRWVEIVEREVRMELILNGGEI